MTIDPTQGPSPSLPSASAPASSSSPSSAKGQIASKPITFLGMYFTAKEAQQLWSMVIQNISNQINKDQQKALKALKKLGPAEDQDS